MTHGSWGCARRWDGLQQSRFELVIPVDWDAVPLAAEDRLAVSLRSVWLSRVQQTPNATNMHLFGVAEGQCPPGTIRYGAFGCMRAMNAWF